MSKKLRISLGGCGILGVYHLGVAKCLTDPHLYSEFDTFYGASSGAIAAVFMVCRIDPTLPYNWTREAFEDSREYHFHMFNPLFDFYGRLRAFLEECLPEDAHILCRNVVKISLTVFGKRGMPENWLVSDFKTRQELINVSNAHGSDMYRSLCSC